MVEVKYVPSDAALTDAQRRLDQANAAKASPSTKPEEDLPSGGKYIPTGETLAVAQQALDAQNAARQVSQPEVQPAHEPLTGMAALEDMLRRHPPEMAQTEASPFVSSFTARLDRFLNALPPQFEVIRNILSDPPARSEFMGLIIELNNFIGELVRIDPQTNMRKPENIQLAKEYLSKPLREQYYTFDHLSKLNRVLAGTEIIPNNQVVGKVMELELEPDLPVKIVFETVPKNANKDSYILRASLQAINW